MLAWGALLAAFCFAPLAAPWMWTADNLAGIYLAVSSALVILSFALTIRHPGPATLVIWLALFSFFICAFSYVPWKQTAGNIVVAYYLMAVACMIILSFGEMMWSPRMSHYIVSVAPEGQEGTYSAFSSLPWFVGKTLAGGLSGVMLAKWCPEFIVQNGVNIPLQQVLISRTLPYWQTPEALWLILGAIAIVGPIIMLFLKNWFTKGMSQKTS